MVNKETESSTEYLFTWKKKSCLPASAIVTSRIKKE